MSNFTAINQIDTALQIGEATYKVSREVYKVSRVLALVTVSLVGLVVTLVKLWVDHEVKEALVKELAPEVKALSPAKEQKLLMPSPEVKLLMPVKAKDFTSMDLEELREIAKSHKIKGWNFYKEESLRAKLVTM